MATEQQLQVGLDRYRDAALQAFEDNLGRIVRKAQAATLQYVLAKLDIQGGIIARTPANLKVMRRLSQVFMKSMDDAGYSALVNAFVSQFPGHLPTIQETLKTISDASKQPLPDLGFTTSDLNLFKSVAASSAQGIQDAIKQEATRTVSKVLFSLGGMPFKEMVSTIQGMGLSLGRAKTIADTAQAIFYRIAADRQYQKIEKATGKLLRYRYSGPNDSKCRPFCHNLMKTPKKSYSREEIDQMDNGQIPNVFISAGGNNCRHSFLISF